MKQRGYLAIAAMMVLMLAGTAMASVQLASLTVNTAEFDFRNFEYGGHFSYEYIQDACSASLNTAGHDVDLCGSSQCGPSNTNGTEYITKCRITSGSSSYEHNMVAKVVRGTETVFGPESDYCDHSDNTWRYHTGLFVQSTHPDTGPYVYKAVIKNNAGAEIEGNPSSSFGGS